MHQKNWVKSNKIIKLLKFCDTLTHLNHKIIKLLSIIIQNILCFLPHKCLYLLFLSRYSILFSSWLLWLLSIIKFITRCLHMATDSVPLCNGWLYLQVVLSVMMQSAVMMLQCLSPLCLQHAVVSAVKVRCLME